MSRVEEAITQLHSLLQELKDIEINSNEEWKEISSTLNELDHELEIIPLNGGQLGKIMAFRKALRIRRRYHKNEWLLAKAFNDTFQTIRVLHSVPNAFKHVRRQQQRATDLIENRGLIESILLKPHAVDEARGVEIPAVKEVASKEVAATSETTVS